MFMKKSKSFILKKLTIFICLIVFIGVSVAPASQTIAAVSRPVRVVCIGDSITEAGTIIKSAITPSYRLDLWKKFVDANIDVQFLGRDTISPTVVYKGKAYPSQHLGWGGNRIEDVNQRLKDGNWGTADSGFDIAVILIGFNNASAWDGKPRPTVPEFNQLMKGLIATVRAKQPNVKIVFQTTPTGKPTNIPEEYVLEYKNIADQANTIQSPIYYLPSPPTYDNSTDTTDAIHPNALGEAKIATGMWNVMKNIVGSGTPLPKPRPAIPTINTIVDSSKTITGKASIGGIITVTIGTKKYTSKVTTSGWKVTLTSKVTAGTKVSVVVSINSISSLVKSIYVIPSTPKVSTIKANSTLIKGSATKGGTIYVKIGTKAYSAKVNTKNGTFSIIAPKIKKGTTVYVTCKLNGRASAVRILKVK